MNEDNRPLLGLYVKFYDELNCILYFFLLKVFVQGSSRFGPNELGSPFGYLKASTNLTSVNLYIMPYNYLELSKLLSK